MQLIPCQDVTFVKNWQRGWDCLSEEPLTKVKPVPESPNKTFYDKHFPALDALIKTPVAFAIISPFGWPGETSWYEHDKIGDYGWTPIAWKESSHCDKTFVQLYMRTLPRDDFKERPSGTGQVTYVAYDNSGTGLYGDLPYLGCSSVLSSMSTPGQAFKIGAPQIYAAGRVGTVVEGRKITRGKVSADECLHLVRLARPALNATRDALLKHGFTRIVQLTWNEYWVKGKSGIGSIEQCEY